MYGEEKCNEFLAYTGRRLKGLLPRGIAGRFGGDQFILFFDYEGEGEEYYQLIAKAVFRRMWDADTEWKIYVSERKMGFVQAIWPRASMISARI